MFTAEVKGHLVATTKHPTLKGARLVIVQPLDPVSFAPMGVPQVAIDVIGTAKGMRVLVVSDGQAVQEMLGADRTCPARLAVSGILNEAPASGGASC
ncbi:MAG: EutN/CcmL family microcompartment protein [Phycisphaerae bacterium]